MDFKIRTEENVEVPLFQVTSIDDPHFMIPGIIGMEATGGFGVMRFYEIEGQGFKIWYSNYKMLQRTCMLFTIDAPWFELHFTLHNTVHYKLDSLPETTLLQGQFNMLYAPRLSSKAWFQKDEAYIMFGIRFSREYLEQVAQNFPSLGSFLSKTDKEIPGMLGKHHGLTTPDMNSIIKRILRCHYTGDVRNVYIQAKVLELVVLALDQIANGAARTTEIVLRPYDIEKIREAHDYLLRNMDNPCTLIELAHKVGINDFKLKKGFKQVYGTTVYESLLDARMEKAKNLLLETDTSIHEIAFITGYKNLSSFITAFKKKMGYSPGSFKRMKRGNGH